MQLLNKYSYKVIKTTPLDKSIYSIEMSPIDRCMEYSLSQICEITCADGKGRYFSIISNPLMHNNLEIHIRLTDKNSEQFEELMTPQSLIELKGPFGKMHNVLQLDNPKIFLAEGLGISAFYSLLNHSNGHASETHLIWIRKDFDKEYSIKAIEKWQKTVRYFKPYVLENSDTSLLKALKHCDDIILKNKKIILGFAGSSKTSEYLQNDFIKKYKGKSVQFITDV